MIRRRLSSWLGKYLTDSTMIYIAFASVFLPYIITGIVTVLLGISILISKKRCSITFTHKNSLFLILFTLFTIIVAAFNLNYIGIFCSLGFLLIMTLSLYLRSTMMKYQFENALTLSCYLSVGITVACIIEYIVNAPTVSPNKVYRCTLYFFNCNYLATIMATVIIICAYKVIARKGNPFIFYSIAAFNLITLYLSGSLFVWVEVLVGIAALLLMTRQHQMLSILLLLAATGCIVLYCIPEIVPRLQDSNITTDNRVVIWQTSLKAIKTSPIFGRGFLTYFHIYKSFPKSYATTHAHNILLEPILSFGIIGTALFLAYFFSYYKRVVVCKNAQSKSQITSLILAITGAALLHGTTDITFLWIQTYLFYALIMSGLGIEERMLKLNANH